MGLTRRAVIGATAGLAAARVASGGGRASAARKGGRPNIVLFTLDDCDAGSIGCFGSRVKGITPNLDALAVDGVRFAHAYTVSSTCQPSRLALMSGLYPQTSGAVGHTDPLPGGTPTLASILAAAGYYTGIIGKLTNYLPWNAFKWTRSRTKDGKGGLTADNWDDRDGYWGNWRAPIGFYRGTKELVSEARAERKPFFLHLNTSDPHRPWPGSVDEVAYFSRPPLRGGRPLRPFSRAYSPMECEVPGYLPDLAGVRVDIAQYTSALHRGDMAFGMVVKALKEAGVYDNTIVICLSDQGASFPMSKQSLYHYALNLGLIIRAPGLVRPGRTVNETMAQIIDVAPTILDFLGLGPIPKSDGKSFARLLKGENMPVRDRAFASYNYASPGLQAFPMRTVITKSHQYIFNAWSGARGIDPRRKLIYDGPMDPLMGLAWQSMKVAAEEDVVLKRRVNFIRLRTREELYDIAKDPFCLENIAGSLLHRDDLDRLRDQLGRRLEQLDDPLLGNFRGERQIPEEWLTRERK